MGAVAAAATPPEGKVIRFMAGETGVGLHLIIIISFLSRETASSLHLAIPSTSAVHERVCVCLRGLSAAASDAEAITRTLLSLDSDTQCG